MLRNFLISITLMHVPASAGTLGRMCAGLVERAFGGYELETLAEEYRYQAPWATHYFPIRGDVDEQLRIELVRFAHGGQSLRDHQHLASARATKDDRNMWEFMRRQHTNFAYTLRKILWVNYPGLTEARAIEIREALARHEHFELPLEGWGLAYLESLKIATGETRAASACGVPLICPEDVRNFANETRQD